MTLIEIQDILGERIKTTLSDMSPEKRKVENEKTALVIGLTKQYVSVQNTIMKAAKMMSENHDQTNVVNKTAFLRNDK